MANRKGNIPPCFTLRTMQPVATCSAKDSPVTVKVQALNRTLLDPSATCVDVLRRDPWLCRVRCHRVRDFTGRNIEERSTHRAGESDDGDGIARLSVAEERKEDLAELSTG